MAGWIGTLGMNRYFADVLDDLIRQRRSIRRYKNDPLPEPWIASMLDCVRQAPSASNSQPVRFVRITSPAYRKALKDQLDSGHAHLLEQHGRKRLPARLRNWINVYRRYCDFMFAAPVLFAVCVTGKSNGFAHKLIHAGLLCAEKHQSVDTEITVGLALKGLMLKAQALGVGSCVLTAPLVFIQEPEKVLNLQDLQIRCFLTLGFADEKPPQPERLPLTAIASEI
jgi:nitroreductase